MNQCSLTVRALVLLFDGQLKRRNRRGGLYITGVYVWASQMQEWPLKSVRKFEMP